MFLTILYSGVNLVMLTFSLYPDNRMLSILKLFIEKYKCDFAKTDYNGNNAVIIFNFTNI